MLKLFRDHRVLITVSIDRIVHWTIYLHFVKHTHFIVYYSRDAHTLVFSHAKL